MKYSTTIWLLGFWLAGIGLMACSDDSSGFGIVQVEWMIKGTTCDKAGIIDVEVQLRQEGTTMLSDDLRCSDGEAYFNEVPAGVYDIRLIGKDGDSNPFFEGKYEGLVVKAGNTVSSPPDVLEMEAKKGTILLAWSFPADQSNLCGFNNVETVEVNVSQAGTAVSLFSGTFPCDPMYADNKDLAAPFEEGRVVISDIPPGEADIVLFGLSPEGVRAYSGEEVVTVPKTGSISVTVGLEPCEDNCI